MREMKGLKLRTASNDLERSKGDVMSSKKIWFITGASRGMGLDFTKAALAAGHAVVASGRDSDRVSRAVGESESTIRHISHLQSIVYREGCLCCGLSWL